MSSINRMLQICCMSAEYHLTFVLGTFELCDLKLAHLPCMALSQGIEAFFDLQQQWEHVEKQGLVGVTLRMKQIEVRIQFLWLSSIPQRGVSGSLCGLLAMQFFFLYLCFICFVKAERTSRLPPL